MKHLKQQKKEKLIIDFLIKFDEFVNDEERNRWLEVGESHIYVRKSQRFLEGQTYKCFDIANVEIENKNEGIFSGFLQKVLDKYNRNNFYVESILNPAMNHILEKSGFKYKDEQNMYKIARSRILFLHGLGSRPFEDRLAILNATGAEIFAPHIDYNTEDSITLSKEIIETEEITHLVGHSLGGILSYYLSNFYKLPALLFNPAFGEHNRIYFEREFPRNPPFKEQYAVVGMQDDVILPQIQLPNLVKHATVFQVEDLGHKIDPTNFKKYVEIFKEKMNIKGEDI